MSSSSNAAELASLSSGEVFVVDSTNSRVGINTGVPSTTLEVIGICKATNFQGDGSNLSNLPASGISNVVEDTTPQLGGNLDLNSKNITGTGNINITGDATVTGNLSVGGTITKEDVTNVDSVGLITARSGIDVTGGRIVGTAVSSVIPFYYNNLSDLPSAVTYHGAFAHVHATGKAYFAHGGAWIELVNKETTGAIAVGILTATNLGIGTVSPDQPLDIRSTSTVPAQFVTETASSNGATVRLRKNDTSTLSADDEIGSLQFSGSNATDAAIYEYASIQTKVITPTAGSEDGVLNIKTTTGGTSTTKISVDDTTVTFTAGLVEKFKNAGTILGAHTNNAISDGNIILFSGNESGNNVINFTGVHSKLSSGESVSFTAIITPNNSGVINTVQIDGINITVKWSGGSTPTAGSSGQDIYSFQILKTGTGTSDYTIFGQASNFA
tara:strand:+ start:1785 stop:3110 length:1326 start_codon:yes stop_codon:yes gene_type:complete